jgi:hypothetical protein
VCCAQRLPLYWIEERPKGTVELSEICRLNNGGSSKPCWKMRAGTSIPSKPISPVCNSPLMQASCAGCPYAHSCDKADHTKLHSNMYYVSREPPRTHHGKEEDILRHNCSLQEYMLRKRGTATDYV